ncbi:LysM peptidoglycan-binding domain-containing protein [Shewanella sp. YLB-07]|uniref:LysM peptidoglycan-binding domain-containing protein n=1 Tax=Shewanella sp. YLB-07 TaxID=2601268 RepID=UPI00128CBB17|nr:LysM domain-containing protein [Shewanella sp. YLB-07]MPY21269.1 LysM peptidoglycan-binding domain-containing protein [Shewanella sp. YLB-07]MPY22056.1 LysM peptidoglycan-binding domain-containing protein [Shewanella sp. YLB-07]
MTTTYTVKQGDTLLGIAIEQNIAFPELLALNPQYQLNPDVIYPGELVTLPSTFEPAEPELTIEPVEPVRPVEPGCVMGKPACKGMDACDVLFLTGGEPDGYYVLDEHAQTLLKQEISTMDKLIEDYRAVLDKAPDNKEASEADVEQHLSRKQAWVAKAVHAGAIGVESSKGATQSSAIQPQNKQYLVAKITELRRTRQLLADYVPFFSESSMATLRSRRLKSIDTEIEKLIAQVPSKPSPESSAKQGVNFDNLGNVSGQLSSRPSQRGIIEIMLVSENRLVYIRAEFLERERRFWRTNPTQTRLRQLIANRDVAGIQQAMFEDIREGLVKDKSNGMLGKLEGNIKKWAHPGWKWKEWKGTKKLWVNEDGDTRFAVSAEAQLLRFSAQASVKTSFEPSEGKVDIGIGGDATFSLAEGKVEGKYFMPYEKGYALTLAYLDSNKQTALYSFGCFRASVGVTLSCFAGVIVNGEAKLSNQEQASGAGILLSANTQLAPTNATGGLGVKAEGFAGVQAGGQVAGALEWQSPDDIATTNFSALAEIKAEGNISFGAGIGGEFQLALESGQFYFYCSGRLVWGPGGSGGFGTTVDFEKLWELVKVIWGALEVVDYHVLDNIDPLAYEYLQRASYYAFAVPQKLLDETNALVKNPKFYLQQAVMSGATAIDGWWRERVRYWESQQYQEAEALRVAERIINQEHYAGIPPRLLPPETIGMLLNTLVTTFWFNWEQQQEMAIYLLLSTSIKSWRKFEESLACMNVRGTKVSGDKALFANLNRINAILDRHQQHDFNVWLDALAALRCANVQASSAPQLPKVYQVRSRSEMRDRNSPNKKQIGQQIARLHGYQPGDTYYV